MAQTHGEGGHSPLQQFEIKSLIDLPSVGGMDVSFTNSSLMMVIALVLITGFMTLAMRERSLVPGRLQMVAESAYEFIANLIRDTVGSEGRPYFPFVFALFMFVLMGNLLGMLPYSFTFTSHIIVTFALAAVVFVLVTVVALMRHGLHFFSYFFPSGAPVATAPLIIPIEILSYLSRPVSLSIRLFANMMAGHTMLKVFAIFTVAMGVFGVLPLAVNVALIGFEVLVAILQAYVFTILTCLYLHDAIHLH